MLDNLPGVKLRNATYPQTERALVGIYLLPYY